MSELFFASTDFDSYTGDLNSKKAIVAKTSNVHIRAQQRTGRKFVTTIAGLADDLDLYKILKCMRKMFSTNGTILRDDDGNAVIQLQGDRRHESADFLIKFCVVETKEEIHLHGF